MINKADFSSNFTVKMERCLDCKFFCAPPDDYGVSLGKQEILAEENIYEGLCLRYPPIVGSYIKNSLCENTGVGLSFEARAYRYPEVAFYDWCGEFKKDDQ